MGLVVVEKPKHDTANRSLVVSTPIEICGGSYEVCYRVSEGPIADGVEAGLAATLVPAMSVGEPLQIAGLVSPRLFKNTVRIQEILHAWDRRLSKIPVEVESKSAAETDSPRDVGCFFSGGVDSFYTLLKNQDEITKIIFVHGFDIQLGDKSLRERVSEAVRNVAAELKKPLVEVETNMREFADHYANWGYHYHGSALASVALLLSPQFRKIYLPATHTYSDLIPWGSHPLIDPLWSTEDTEIVHDGCEATRVEKVARIASCETALRSLRVCWENRGGAYNCGQCEKCLRTMINLRVAGALERCTTFDRPLDLAEVARMAVPDLNTRAFVEENLRAVEESGNDPGLAQALHDCLRQPMSPADKSLTEALNEKLHERDCEIACLRAVVVGYERGRVMRALNTLERLRYRMSSRLHKLPH